MVVTLFIGGRQRFSRIHSFVEHADPIVDILCDD